MGGVSRQILNCSHLFSGAVLLIDTSLKTYFQELSQATLPYLIKRKASTHIFLAVFSKMIEQKTGMSEIMLF